MSFIKWLKLHLLAKSSNSKAQTARQRSLVITLCLNHKGLYRQLLNKKGEGVWFAMLCRSAPGY
jgi:hypothetical protein